MEQSSILSKAYNCDCLEYMKSLPDNYFDLAIADPPYGIGASKPSKKPSNILQKNGSIMSASVTDFGKKDWDNNIPTQEFFDELRRVSKNQIIWGASQAALPHTGWALTMWAVNLIKNTMIKVVIASLRCFLKIIKP